MVEKCKLHLHSNFHFNGLGPKTARLVFYLHQTTESDSDTFILDFCTWSDPKGRKIQRILTMTHTHSVIFAIIFYICYRDTMTQMESKQTDCLLLDKHGYEINRKKQSVEGHSESADLRRGQRSHLLLHANLQAERLHV